MNSFAIVFAALLAIASANAGLLAHSVVAPLAHGTTLQGPSTRTTVVGPEGSVISAVAPGGAIHTEVDTGLAAHTGHVVAAPVPEIVAARYAYPAAYSAYSAPVVAAHGVVNAYSAPYVAHHGVYAPGVVARSVYGAHLGVYPAGHGIEGQYVHDYTERLYDDGSYKGEIY